jgi:outer membrane receptor protein involved in Fe transport
MTSRASIVRACLSTAIAALVASNMAHARAQEVASPVQDTSDGGQADASEAIVVTGSRIARPEIDSAMPVSVTSMDEAFDLGRISAYDALTRDPAVGLGVGLNSSFGQNWDGGVASINLRNLGTNRSLTLIDGQRRVSGSARSSAVDINMIPAGMIDRIEVVTGGAAAIYGADAVTGAVNIITKRNIDKTTLMATGGISQQGDGSEFQVSLATGGKFADDRGSFTFGATYSKTTPLMMQDRYSWDDQPLYLPNPANTGIGDGIPDRVTLYHYRQIYYSYEPTFFLNNKNYILDGNNVREAVHDVYYGRGEFALGDGGDGRNLEDQRQLRGGQQALAVMGRYDYELTDAIDYGGYFSYARTEYRGTASPYRDDSRATFLGGAGGSVASLDNPYLPDSIRQVMLANNLTKLKISRTFGNFPIRTDDHDRDTFTFGQTLGGKLTDNFRWQAFAQYGRAVDNVTTRNIPYKSRWIAARDVIADPVTGAPICRDAAARAAGCLPLNIFGQDAPSEALLNYVMADRKERRVNTQKVFGASVNGDLFALPYGDVSIAVGTEYRVDTLKTRDDPLALTGELVYSSGPAAHPELDAKSSVTEFYGEVVVPVLRDLPFVHRLEVEGAYRYSDYSTVGGTHTWKAGATWAPIDGLTFRGVRSRSVRTPNFGELYEAQIITQQGSIDDPCELGAYYASATRAANCAALGVTTPLPDVKVGPWVTTGGNPDLKPETSNSLTLGVIFEPKFLPGFDLTADYWSIDIKDVITQFNYSRLLYLCVDLPTIDNPFCKLSQREAPLGNPVSITSTQVNASRMYARGIDVGANYRASLGGGQLRLGFKGSYLLENVTETTPGISAGDVINDGGWQNPRFRGTLLVSYKTGGFNISLDTRFISASKYEENVDSPESYDDNSVPSRLYNDLALSFDIDDDHMVGFGVRNIGNVKPPYMPTLYYNSSMYDIVGRYFYANVKVSL